jgi:hypothetical protein
MKKILFIIILNFFLLTSFVDFSFAEPGDSYTQRYTGNLTYKLLSGGGPGIQDPFPINKYGQANSRFLGYAFDLIIGISIALAVIIFMVGAFGNIFGEASIGGIKANKEMMKNSVGGLIITLSFYLILQTINPDLVKFPLFNNLNIGGERTAGAVTPSAVAR